MKHATCKYIKIRLYHQLLFYIHFSDITVSFKQSTYDVNENDGSIQIFVVLSNPSSTMISVDVHSTDSSAIGELHM